jgi:hypothetical protein
MLKSYGMWYWDLVIGRVDHDVWFQSITVPLSLGPSSLKTAQKTVQSHNTRIPEDLYTQQRCCEKITFVSNSVSKTHWSLHAQALVKISIRVSTYAICLVQFGRVINVGHIGLLTGHNTLRQHLHLLGLQDSPLCRKCGVMEETSAHILCECETLASLRHAHLGSLFLEPEDIQSISLGAIWSFSNASGLPWLDMGHKGPVYKGLGASGPRGPEPLTYSSGSYWSDTHYCLDSCILPRLAHSSWIGQHYMWGQQWDTKHTDLLYTRSF